MQTSGVPLTKPAYWSRIWEEREPENYVDPGYDFAPLWRKYLPRKPGLRCLELGCAPGALLLYLAKEFGYAVAGVDFSPEGMEIARANARKNDVDADLRTGDLFDATFEEPFDVVLSLGLVEHFGDPRPVIARHLDFLRPGGTLVLSVPNLRGIHGLLFPLVDRVDYIGHNRRTCSPYRLGQVVRRIRPDARILYCGYWTTARLYYPAPAPLGFLAKAMAKLLRMAGMHQIGNRWFSPHGYLIARVGGEPSSDIP